MYYVLVLPGTVDDSFLLWCQLIGLLVSSLWLFLLSMMTTIDLWPLQAFLALPRCTTNVFGKQRSSLS